ncbi:MAG: glycosyltransferase family 61 protein [Pseudomonadota bacterium]
MRGWLANWLLRDVSAESVYARVQPYARIEVERPAVTADAPIFSHEADYLLDEAGRFSTRTARVVPHALIEAWCNVTLSRPGRVLRESDNTWREHPGRPFHEFFYWRYQYTRPRRDVDGTVMALRSPANNYYHTLVDNLPRLFWLHHPALRDEKLRVLVSGKPYAMEEWFLKRLLPPNAEIFEADRSCLWRAERVVVADYLSDQMSGALPRAYLDFFLPRVLPQRPRQRRHRLYISRRQAPGGRRILNEDAVRNLLESRGFQVCLMETLDIAAQIELFYDAECVVAPHGAGLTNTLFAQTIDLVELHPTAAIMPHYYFMARAMGHRYHALCAAESGRHSSFQVDIHALAQLIDRVDENRER